MSTVQCSSLRQTQAFLPIRPVFFQRPQIGSSVTTVRNPRKAVVAVLDVPSSVNPYLQDHSAAIIRDYLTRRAVHTILFYFAELGDTPSSRYLKNFDAFEQKEREDKFHDGDAFIQRLINAKPEKGVIVQRHPRGYFSRKFPFTITPSRIAQSILESRKQLAEEWAKDLRCVESYNLEIQRMSFEKLFEKDERILNSKRNLVFDYDFYTSNQTPLRFKNFKALVVLVTQHAIARLLPYLRDTCNHDYMFMIQFVSRYGPLKDGDDFVRALMEVPREHRTNPQFTIDPRGLAMHIMALRRVIAEEWISVMEKVPEEQLNLQKTMLKRAMRLTALGEDMRKGMSSRETDSNEVSQELDEDGSLDITGP